jgi:hypothetical protein
VIRRNVFHLASCLSPGFYVILRRTVMNYAGSQAAEELFGYARSSMVRLSACGQAQGGTCAQQEDISWVPQYLMRDTILLRRAICGPLFRSRPEKMFNAVQGMRLKSFRGLRPCI